MQKYKGAVLHFCSFGCYRWHCETDEMHMALAKHTFCTWLVQLAWAKDGAKSPTDHWKYSNCGLRQRRTEQGKPHWHKPNVKKCNNAYCKRLCILSLAGNAKLENAVLHLSIFGCHGYNNSPGWHIWICQSATKVQFCIFALSAGTTGDAKLQKWKNSH